MPDLQLVHPHVWPEISVFDRQTLNLQLFLGRPAGWQGRLSLVWACGKT